MPETAAAEAATAPAQEPTSAPANDQPTTPPKADTDWVAEARKWEARAKENAAKVKTLEPAAARLAEIEESKKTEAQKLADQLAEARREASDAKREAFAAIKGVPASLVTGSTPAEWEAAVAEALAWKGEAPKTPAAPPADGQGKVGKPVGNGAPQLTRGDLAGMTPEQIVAAKAEGRLNTLLGIH